MYMRIIYILCLILLLTGCGRRLNINAPPTTAPMPTIAPFFSRSTYGYALHPTANPYTIAYSVAGDANRCEWYYQ